MQRNKKGLTSFRKPFVLVYFDKGPVIKDGISFKDIYMLSSCGDFVSAKRNGLNTLVEGKLIITNVKLL